MKHAQGDTTPSLPPSRFPHTTPGRQGPIHCSPPNRHSNPTGSVCLNIAQTPTPDTHPNPPQAQRAPRPSPPYLAASGIEPLEHHDTSPCAGRHACRACMSVRPFDQRLDIHLCYGCVWDVCVHRLCVRPVIRDETLGYTHTKTAISRPLTCLGRGSPWWDFFSSWWVGGWF